VGRALACCDGIASADDDKTLEVEVEVVVVAADEDNWAVE
jgi:hypothetical protein